MNLATLTWLTLGGCILYIVASDSNVYEWLVLQSKFLKVQAQRWWFMVRYNPDSPWVRFSIHRNANRIAKEFIKNRDESN
jgi:hypothetical protein